MTRASVMLCLMLITTAAGAQGTPGDADLIDTVSLTARSQGSLGGINGFGSVERKLHLPPPSSIDMLQLEILSISATPDVGFPYIMYVEIRPCRDCLGARFRFDNPSIGSAATIDTGTQRWGDSYSAIVDAANGPSPFIFVEMYYRTGGIDATVEMETVLRAYGDIGLLARAGDDQSVECTSYDGGVATLDGTESIGNIALYDWLLNDDVIATGSTAEAVLPLGEHAITLHIEDVEGNSSSDQVVVRVIDTAPPALSVANSGTPPPVSVEQGCSYQVLVADACDPDPTVVGGTSVVDGDEVGVGAMEQRDVVVLEGPLVLLGIDQSGNSIRLERDGCPE